MFLLAKKNQSRLFVPSHGGNRNMDMNKFFLGDSRSLRNSLKVTAPNVLVHLSVFIPMAMALRQLSFGTIKTDTMTSDYVISDSSFLWIDSLLTPSFSLSAVLFTIHVINWRINLIRPTPIRGLKKAKQPPIFLIFPAVQALMGTQLPATLVLYWTMTAILATVESLTFRLPLNSFRKSLKLQPNSVYLFPSGSRELCEAVGNGSYYPGVESAKHTIQNSDILEPGVRDILIKSLERK
ncbi:uncharacterized protein LOC142340705 [Convolutriloba macropyga]|uniref:uncharacterized protein LOC142340705 n=1 Tax=Convolutriloba macropyga TaxID=536237 RepID=UPI003F51FEE2